MSLINLVVTLVVVGVALWAINTYVPMDQKNKVDPERSRRDRGRSLAAARLRPARRDRLDGH
nr:Thivi_2564 family membrane protein [Rhodovulum strictum]